MGGDVPGDPLGTPTPAGRANLLPQPYHIVSPFGHYSSDGAHYGLDIDARAGVD